MKFLANVNINYPNKYKKLPEFFRICCTKVIFNNLFREIRIKGFNGRNSFFLFPENSLSLNGYLEILQKKIDGQSFFLNAIIINNRLINIYKDAFTDLFKEQNRVLFCLKFSLLLLLLSLNLLNIYMLSFFNFYITKIKNVQ